MVPPTFLRMLQEWTPSLNQLTSTTLLQLKQRWKTTRPSRQWQLASSQETSRLQGCVTVTATAVALTFLWFSPPGC